jgi:hypothetical protein
LTICLERNPLLSQKARLAMMPGGLFHSQGKK